MCSAGDLLTRLSYPVSCAVGFMRHNRHFKKKKKEMKQEVLGYVIV